jgi:fatty-acyl-CoA synthase
VSHTTSVQDRQEALAARYPDWPRRRLDEQLDAAAAEFPDRPYVVTDERTWTYREMQEWSVRVARGLVAAGVRPGEHVALVMANHPEFVAAKFGIARAGATCVPVNFLNRRAELGYVLAQSDSVLLITMDRFRGLDYLSFLDELAPGWERAGGGDTLPALRKVVVFGTEGEPLREGVARFADLGSDAVGGLPVPADPDAFADVLYTSGTTGQAKGVLLTHDMLLRVAYGSAYGRAFEDGRRITFALPMYHVFGYVEGMLSVLFVGGSIVAQRAFSPAATLAAIARHRATDVMMVPTMTLALLDEIDAMAERGEAPDLSSLTSLISSGGVSPSGLWERIEEMFPGVELTTGYGMSETTASTTVTSPDDPAQKRRETNGRLRDVGVAGEGRLLVEYRVVDPVTRADVPAGEVGELVARGRGVTSGYYRKPEETAAAFADGDGWLRTGDLGRIDAEGYLVLAGRVKECYRCGGEQVMPLEVEALLTTHPDVAQAFVVPVPDRRMGEVGVAWVVRRAGSAVSVDELSALCAEGLARFKQPRHVLFLTEAEVPTTPSGRPRKFLLAERAAERVGAPSTVR